MKFPLHIHGQRKFRFKMLTRKMNKPISIRTNVRAGGLRTNHGLRVRTNVRAGGLRTNHGLRVRTALVEST